MHSVGHLKQFVSDKLAAAAEEIFAVFHNTIVEYEKELDRHRKLMELAWKPEVKLRRIDLPRLCVFNEELAVDEESFLDQDRAFTLDQDELELPLIKEQQEELSILEFTLKEEPEDLLIYSADGETNRSGDTVVDWNPEVSAANIDLSLETGVSQSQELAGLECQKSTSRRQNWKNMNNNFQNKQLENDQDVTLPTPSTSLTHNGRRNKLNNTSKVQKNEKNHLDETLELSSCGTVLQHKTIHTANMPYSCQECGKSFPKRLRLTRHKKTHTNRERPHACPTCGKSFLTRAHLKQHEAIHTGERTHVCQVCNKRFLLSKSLTDHMRTHTGERPHGCQICNKRFLFRRDVTRHMRIHTVVKPHVCQSCGKGFTQRIHLTQHMMVHRGEKRLSCKECGKSFPGSFSLTHHVASAHYDF